MLNFFARLFRARTKWTDVSAADDRAGGSLDDAPTAQKSNAAEQPSPPHAPSPFLENTPSSHDDPTRPF